MNRNLKLIPYPDQKLRVAVTLTPLGDRIKYRIDGTVVCSRYGKPRLLPRSVTYHRDDLVWNAVFGSKLKTKKFLKRNRVVRKIIPISHLGYSPCDSIR